MMKLRNILAEGDIIKFLKSLITGKVYIDDDSEMGKILKDMDRELKKKMPGENKTKGEYYLDLVKKQGIKIK